MNENGKGDKKRPMKISHDQYRKNWDAIFKNQRRERRINAKPTHNSN